MISASSEVGLLDDEYGIDVTDDLPKGVDKGLMSQIVGKPVVVRGLRPKQVQAATLLCQGRSGREVAMLLHVTPETVSRWKHNEDFQGFMRELLMDTVEATRFGIVSLCAESILHLRGMINGLDNRESLKAIALVMNRVAPVLGIVGGELSPRTPRAST